MKLQVSLLTTLLFITLQLSASAKELEAEQKAPDFTVKNIQGEDVSLSDYKGKKNLVVVFSRAYWCPFCMAQLSDLARHYEKIQKKDTEVLVVFREERDGLSGLKKSKAKSGAKFPLLLDAGKIKTSVYSTNGYTTYIINKEGVIKDILAGKKTKRPETSEIIKSVGHFAS